MIKEVKRIETQTSKDHSNAQALEEHYFKNQEGNSVGR